MIKNKIILFISPKPEMNSGFKFNRVLKSIIGNFLPINTTPLSLIYLASMTPNNYKKYYITESPREAISKIKYIKKKDNYSNKEILACISISSCEAKSGYIIADYLRKKGIKVIIGGIHASIMSNETKKHTDSVFIGEAEEIWSNVLKDYEKNKLKEYYQFKPKNKWISLKNKRIYSKKFGIMNSAIESTRGCPRNCSFCAVTALYGKQIRHRKIDDLIKEIKYLKTKQTLTKNFFFFVDDNIIIDKKYAKQLFSALIPLNIKWFAQADISFGLDKDLIKLAYKSGCRFVFIGFESTNQNSLNEANKNTTFNNYVTAISNIKSNGIKIMGSFVIGFDSDTKEIIKENIKFATKNKIDFPAFSILIPYPKTELYNKLNEEKRIYDYDWEHYSKRVVFNTKNFKKGELENIILSSHKRFYNIKNLLKRIYQLKFKEKIPKDERILNIMLFIAIYISNYLRPKAIYKKYKLIK
jgi:radical SAM superfamily enzyme YgiQ (UPF0313 family)